jgi:hypothetical protein
VRRLLFQCIKLFSPPASSKSFGPWNYAQPKLFWVLNSFSILKLLNFR